MERLPGYGLDQSWFIPITNTATPSTACRDPATSSPPPSILPLASKSKESDQADTHVVPPCFGRRRPSKRSRSTSRSLASTASTKVFRGVRMRSWGKWVSEIRQPKKRSRIWLGSYSTPEAAAKAYDMALYCLRGPLAALNFPALIPREDPPADLSPRDVQKAAVAAGLAADKHHFRNSNITAANSKPTYDLISSTSDLSVNPCRAEPNNSQQHNQQWDGSTSASQLRRQQCMSGAMGVVLNLNLNVEAAPECSGDEEVEEADQQEQVIIYNPRDNDAVRNYDDNGGHHPHHGRSVDCIQATSFREFLSPSRSTSTFSNITAANSKPTYDLISLTSDVSVNPCRAEPNNSQQHNQQWDGSTSASQLRRQQCMSGAVGVVLNLNLNVEAATECSGDEEVEEADQQEQVIIYNPRDNDAVRNYDDNRGHHPHHGRSVDCIQATSFREFLSPSRSTSTFR